ncbi:MAG: hypothetical protein R3F37_06415 [Candidatus Competibacteraceae bacterium]
MDLDITGASTTRVSPLLSDRRGDIPFLLGFTNIDDIGQEGLELAFNDELQGRPGSKRVLGDRFGRIVENVSSIRLPESGQMLVLSIDRRIQYLTYRSLKAAVSQHRGRWRFSRSAGCQHCKFWQWSSARRQP